MIRRLITEAPECSLKTYYGNPDHTGTLEILYCYKKKCADTPEKPY